MRAAVLWDVDDLRIQDVEIEPPKAGEALIRMAASACCRTSTLSAASTGTRCRSCSATRARGRGGAGGDRARARGSRRLLVAPACGLAAGARREADGLRAPRGVHRGFLSDGTTRYCSMRIHHNVPSSHAERSVVPATTLFPVDPALPLEQVALLGCAVMTGVGAVLNTAKVRPATRSS